MWLLLWKFLDDQARISQTRNRFEFTLTTKYSKFDETWTQYCVVDQRKPVVKLKGSEPSFKLWRVVNQSKWRNQTNESILAWKGHSGINSLREARTHHK